MEKLNDKTVHDVFGDGQVILKRTMVRNKLNLTWQAEIKTPSSTGRIRKSTKTKDLETAIAFSKHLNEKGVETFSGGKWYPQTVKNTLGYLS